VWPENNKLANWRLQGIGESRYGADAGASLSLSLNNTVRIYLNYDANFARCCNPIRRQWVLS
jgi:hypothetical protein